MHTPQHSSSENRNFHAKGRIFALPEVKMVDLKKIREIYKIGMDLSLKDVQVLFNAARSRTFKAGEYLIPEGSTHKEVFFVREGLVRVFMIKDKGDEVTLELMPENHTVACADMILHERPSRFFYQAYEDTKTFSLDYDRMQEIIARNPKLEKNRKNILHKILKRSQERVESFVLYNPEERYLNYIEQYPELSNRVPNKFIANVLGITPVSLSRIRKRIATRR